MSLSEAQMECYRRAGYVSVPHFFNAREVAAMVAELERFKREGLLRNVATAEAAANLQVVALWEKSALFRAVPFHPRLAQAVTKLIGEPALLEHDQIFLKPARHGKGTGWHQDNAYFNLPDPEMGVGVWVALHDATVENGTMHVVPEVFRQKFEHRRDPDSDHHVKMQANEDRAVAVDMAAGGTLFFNYGVPHCTRANNTDRERAGLALHFAREEYVTDKFVKADRRGNPLINGPDATGGVKEYGVEVAGTWEAELERALAG